MLTIRCDGEQIATCTTGSRDVMYRDREFAAPFVAGERLTTAASPLFAELAGLYDSFEHAEKVILSLPANAKAVTIRDEYRY